MASKRGSKKAYTSKQKRQAEHIADSYAKHGKGKKEAKRRAWATVNATSGGGKKSGSGRGKAENERPAKKGGKKAAAKRAGTKKTAAKRVGTKKTATRRAGTKKRASKKSSKK